MDTKTKLIHYPLYMTKEMIEEAKHLNIPFQSYQIMINEQRKLPNGYERKMNK
jgi:hypothetical protein